MDGGVIKLARNILFVRWWVAGRGLLWHVAWVVELASLREHFVRTVMVDGRVRSSIALGMDSAISRLARNSLSVWWLKLAGAGSSMAFGMDGGVIRLVRNTLFVRWWVAGRGLLWHVAWAVE
jgi:hypothetical protein